MATIEGAINELIDELAQIQGIYNAPPTPLEQVTAWPVAMVYNSSGQLSENRASFEDKSLHDVEIVVLMPLNNLNLAVRTMLPLYELVVKKLIQHLNGRTSNNYETWQTLNYTLGPIDWPQGQLMYGYLFTIGGMKIINDVST